MKQLRKNEILYFYKGKFYTELGLKRVLIKDGRVWVSRGTFYLYEKTEEYYWHFDTLRDILNDKGVINAEEYAHFQKWINKKEKEGEVKVLRNFTFFHCDENDGLGDDWNECLDALRDFGNSNIKTDEEVIEDYCQTISEEEFKAFLKLPDLKQFNIASKWAIKTYNERSKSHD